MSVPKQKDSNCLCSTSLLHTKSEFKIDIFYPLSCTVLSVQMIFLFLQNYSQFSSNLDIFQVSMIVLIEFSSIAHYLLGQTLPKSELLSNVNMRKLNKSLAIFSFFALSMGFFAASEQYKEHYKKINIGVSISQSELLTISYILCIYQNFNHFQNTTYKAILCIFGICVWSFSEIYLDKDDISFDINILFVIGFYIGSISIVLFATLAHKKEKLINMRRDDHLKVTRTMLDSVPLGALLLDAEGNILFCNSEINKIFDPIVTERKETLKSFLFNKNICSVLTSEALKDFKRTLKFIERGHLNKEDMLKSEPCRNLSFREAFNIFTSIENCMSKAYLLELEELKTSNSPRLKLRRPSGVEKNFEDSYCCYEVNFIRFDQRGGKEGNIFLITLKNITQAIQTTQAKEQWSYKLKLLNSFSHELKTPLNGSLSVLEVGMTDQNVDPIIRKRYLQQPHSSLRMLSILINDIVDYLKLDIQSLNIEYSRFKLNDLLMDVVELAAGKAVNKGIKFTTDFKDGWPEFFATDMLRLKSILINLICNCIKNTFIGQVNLKIDVTEGEDLLVEIRDTRFRADDDLCLEKVNYEYSWKNLLEQEENELGLYVSRKIIEILSPPEHEGLRFFMNKKEGVYFRFRIKNFINNNEICYCSGFIDYDKYEQTSKHSPSPNPYTAGKEGLCFFPMVFESADIDNFDDLKESEEKNLPRSTLKSPNFLSTASEIDLLKTSARLDKCSCEKALIIDDDGFNIYSLDLLLVKNGIKSVKAFNGKLGVEAALNYYKDRKCNNCKGLHFILMDLNMPVMDGFKASEILINLMREKTLPSSIPIFACSANDSQSDIRRCLNIGMQGFISKPITQAKLSEMLCKLCET